MARRRPVAALALGLALLAARPACAAGALTADAGYSLLRHALMLTCTYEAPQSWFVSLSVGGWYWPSLATALEGYSMADVFDGDAFLSAGYAFRFGEGLTLSVGGYAGAWFHSSHESIGSAAYGLSAADDGILLAPRAGIQADLRWFLLPDLGLRFRLAAPWQLFQFTTLGLSQGCVLIGIEAGVCWRIPMP